MFYYIKDELADFVQRIFDYLEKDQTLKNDLATYQTLYNNRELAANRIESKRYQPSNIV